MPDFSVTRRNQPQYAPTPVSIVCHTGSNMRRDPLDVFHQGDRLLEDVVIDPLQDVAMRYPSHIEEDFVSVVDMAAAVGSGLEKLAADFERACRGGDTAFITHDQSLSGYLPARTRLWMLSTTLAW